MSVHIGEMTSQVDVQGAGGGAASPAGGGAPVPPWEQLDKHRRWVEDETDRRRRLAPEGFDG